MLIKFTGMVPKWILMFTYEERMLPIPGALSPFGIWIGGLLIPFVNSITDFLTGFKQTDHNVNVSSNLYPGQSHCKYDQAHSIWHEVSGNGLMDIMFYCDYVNSLIVQYV